MQPFVNQAALERASAEAFAGARARYWLIALLGVAVAATAGAALGAVWLGFNLLAEEVRKLLTRRAEQMPRSRAKPVLLVLDTAAAACMALAPALSWYSSSALGPPLAAAMLCVLAMHAALTARNGRIHALIACAPCAVLGVAFLGDAAAVGELAAAGACALLVVYVFGAALDQNHRAAHARVQDAEWVRQLNMTFGETATAAWELDFERGRLIGGRRLSALLGRPVSYRDIVDSACFAAPEDRPIAHATFAPARGAMRRIALEHDVTSGDGARVRVRHQGFIRTTPDGAPARLICVTRRIAESVAMAPADLDPRDAAAALAVQVETLKKLRNELALPAAPAAAIADIASAGLAQLLRSLGEHAAAIDRGVDDLAHARHSADSANLAKSQFLANMSHELRTPLNAVIGYAEMLLEDAEDADDDRMVQDLNRILAGAKHLLSLLNEILDLSKIEAGRMDVAAAEFEPIDVLQDALDTIKPQAEQNGNVVCLSGAPGQPANSDAMKIRQCVLNLLSNAAKFTQNGRIEVGYERRDYNGVDHLIVTVRDTGIGMAKEHLERLFQPFVQADPTIMQKYGGTGLGLAITRRLAQLMGGDVSVASAPGKGSTFTLRIPANFADAAAALGAAAAVDAVQGADDAPLVIVIEDEPDARELAARALTRAGFAVQGVGGGDAGLALARAKNPALVLLDIFLPDRSGWRVLQSLKQDPATKDVPVVVLSVNEDRAHAMALGAAEHIVKPADRDALAATVMRFARIRPSVQQRPAAKPAQRKKAR